MKLRQVRVRNFKIFEDSGWVDVEQDLSVLVGENESGKTTFLEAIEFFQSGDKFESEEEYLCDKTDPNEHKIPIITLEFDVDSKSLAKLSEIDARFGDLDKLRITKYWDGSKQIHNKAVRENIVAPSDHKEVYTKFRKIRRETLKSVSKFEETRSFYEEGFTQDLNKEYQSLNLKELKTVIKQIIKDVKAAPVPNENARSMQFKIQRDLEDIYGDMPEDNENVQGDIMALLPDIIFYSQDNQLQDEITLGQLESSNKRSTFRNLLKLAGIDKIETYIDKEMKEQFRIQTKIERDITLNLNEYWDQKEVRLEIKDNEHGMSVFIQDVKKDNQRVDRHPELPSQRSKGFNWFLSFYINFKAISENQDNSIILLDDPAVYLHPKGKQNWVDAIQEISEDNQVIYTAHSPYSIDKRHLGKVRLVKDEGESKSKITSNPSEADKMTLEPLRSALGLDLGDSLFFNRKNLLVEGETDFHIIKGILSYFNNHNGEMDLRENITVMSCNGSNIDQYAEWLTSEGFEIRVLLDNDEGGDKHANKLKSQVSELDDEDIVRVSDEEGAEIEDIFDLEMYMKQLDEEYGQITEFPEFEFEEGEILLNNSKISYESTSEGLDNIFGQSNFELNRGHKKHIGKRIRERLENGNISLEEEEAIKPLAGRIKQLMG